MWATARTLGTGGGAGREGGGADANRAVALQAGAPFAALVRLTVGVATAAAAGSAPLVGADAIATAAVPPGSTAAADASEDDDEDCGGQATRLAARARAKALAMRLEALLPEVRDWCIVCPQMMGPDTLTLLCPKANVGRLYKALATAAPKLGGVMTLGPVKAAISLEPLGNAALRETLAAAASTALSAARWLPLPGESSTAVAADLLALLPGASGTAPWVEFDLAVQEPSTLLLFTRHAGAVRYRRFSVAAALTQERPPLPAPLVAGEGEEAIVQDAAKLRAAGRLLEGQPLKLLPDQRVVFLRSLLPASAVPPQQAAALSARWLAVHGLRLPESPAAFYVVVSPRPEDPDGPGELVPACCVLTALGLSHVTPAATGGLPRGAALGRVLAALTASRSAVWGPGGLRVATPDGGDASQVAGEESQQQGAHRGGAAQELAYQPTFSRASALLMTAGASDQLATAGTQQEAAPAAVVRPASGETGGGTGGPAGGGATAGEAVLLLNMAPATCILKGTPRPGGPLQDTGGFSGYDGDGAAGWGDAEAHPYWNDGWGGSGGGGEGASGDGAHLAGNDDWGSREEAADGGHSMPALREGLEAAGAAAAGPGGARGGAPQPRRPRGVSKISVEEAAKLKAFLDKKIAEKAAEKGPAPAAAGQTAALQQGVRTAAATATGVARGGPAAGGPPRPPLLGGGARGKALAAGGSKQNGKGGTAKAPKAVAGAKRGAAAAGDDPAGGKPPAAKRAKKAEGGAAGAKKAAKGEAAAAAAVAGETAAATAAAAAGEATAAAGACNLAPATQQEGPADAAATAAAPEPIAGAPTAAGAEPAAAAAKKPRAKAPGPDATAAVAKVVAALSEAVAASATSLKGVTGPELQCYMRAHKLIVGGKKAELEARALQHYAATRGAAGGGG